VMGTGMGVMETLVAAGRLSANQFLIRGALPCSAILPPAGIPRSLLRFLSGGWGIRGARSFVVDGEQG